MIFFHFTSFYNLENVGPENILAAGLKAMPVKGWWAKEAIGTIRRCVWLTTNPDMSPLYASYSEVRISLVISSSDRRLVHLPKLLRKRACNELMTELDADTGGHWRTFYMYLSDITLNYIRVVEYADPARREPMLSGAAAIPFGAS